MTLNKKRHMKYSDDPELFERHVEMWKSTELDSSILEQIANWNFNKPNSARKLLDYVQSLWSMPELTEKRGGWYRFVTLGDGQNERIIRALQKNLYFWDKYWESSSRGGEYIFKNYHGFYFGDNPFYKYIISEGYIEPYSEW